MAEEKLLNLGTQWVHASIAVNKTGPMLVDGTGYLLHAAVSWF